MSENKWLDWAVELQSLAQAGLKYTNDVFDRERFERIREISAEIWLTKAISRLKRCAIFFAVSRAIKLRSSIPALP